MNPASSKEVQEDPAVVEVGSSKMEEEDRFSTAAVLLDDVILGRHMDFKVSKKNVYTLFKRREFRVLAFFTAGLHLALVLFEEPTSVASLGLPFWITAIPEILCLSFYTFRLFLEASFSPSSKVFWYDPKHLGVAILIGLNALDILIFAGLNEAGIRFSRPLRPLFFVSFPEGRQMRQAFRNIRRTLPEIFRVLVLLMLSIAIFTLMAYKLFSRKNLVKANGTPYLNNYFDTLWDMYVLGTSANNPDIMMPGYDYSRWYAAFFVTYVVITLYIFMNVVLAVIYNNYKRNLRNEMTEFYRRKCELLIRIFKLTSKLDEQESAGEGGALENRFLCQEDFMNLLKLTFPGRSVSYYESLWFILDSNGDRRIDFREFMQLDDLVHIPYTDLTTHKTFLERTWPRVYNSVPSEFVKTVVRNVLFRYTFDIIIIVNALFIAFDLDGAEWYFLVLFTLEIILKLYSFGPKLFVSKLWNIFDILVVGSALIISVVQEILNEFQESAISLDVLLALRVLRLFKIFHSIERFRTVLNTILYIVPSLTTYGGILMVFYYFFALIGMEVFGQEVRRVAYNSTNPGESAFCGNPLLEGSDFYRNHYCSNNFNDVISSFVVLFELMVVNQWHVLSEGYVLVTESKWTRIYFLAFHLTCVTVILNIYTAFVLEAFIMEYAALHSSKNSERINASSLAQKINEMGLAFGSAPNRKRGRETGDSSLLDADHNDLQFREDTVDDSGLVIEEYQDYSHKTPIRFSLSSRARTGYKLLEKMFCQDLKSQNIPEAFNNDL